MSPFAELESPVDDLRNAAQVLATLFEDIQGTQYPGGKQYVLYDHDHTLLAFMVYDLCKRTTDLREAFYAAFEAEVRK